MGDIPMAGPADSLGYRLTHCYVLLKELSTMYRPTLTPPEPRLVTASSLLSKSTQFTVREALSSK